MTSTAHPGNSAQRKERRWPAILFFVLLSLGFLWFTRFKAPQTLHVDQLALVTLAGHPLLASLYQNKAVILSLWAPWCGPCNLEAPWLEAVQQKFGGKLEVIGVDNDPDTYGQVPEFASRTGVTYPLVMHSSRIRSAIGTVAGVPTTFYIDRRGKVLHTVSGAIPQAEMERYANDIIDH
jgi:Thiol-disulfide isomerase and thioredoxins